jgi:putative SOS response-associated peptidase YedK
MPYREAIDVMRCLIPAGWFDRSQSDQGLGSFFLRTASSNSFVTVVYIAQNS